MVGRLVVLWLVCFMLAWPAAAKEPSYLRLSLESSEIFLGDVVVLEVSSTGLLDPIDFSPLDDVAEVGRQTVGTHIAVTDGRVVEVRTSRIELTPRRLGTLVIGPLAAGEAHSNSVKVEVLEDRPIAWTPTADDIRLDQTVSTTRPWLQQQVVLDVKVRHRHPLSEERIELPDLTGFRVVPIFEERRTLDQGGDWAVIGWRYLVFPERSGEVLIEGARFSAMLSKSRAERATVKLTAPDMRLTVKPAAFAPGEWWLAANKVRIRDDWSADPRELSAGDEVERTITVAAEGVLAEQIPDIAMDETGGLSIRPVGESREGKVGDDGASATAAFRFRVRALSPIPVFVDTVRLHWWNVGEKRAEDAIVPARRIDIGVPDRDKLLANAETDWSAWDTARPWFNPPGGVLAAITAAAVLILGLTGLVLGFGTGRARQDPARKALQLARRAARSGDASALHAALRSLSRLAGREGPFGRLRERLETEMIGDSSITLAGYESELKHLSRNGSGGPAARRDRLPSL